MDRKLESNFRCNIVITYIWIISYPFSWSIQRASWTLYTSITSPTAKRQSSLGCCLRKIQGRHCIFWCPNYCCLGVLTGRGVPLKISAFLKLCQLLRYELKQSWASCAGVFAIGSLMVQGGIPKGQTPKLAELVQKEWSWRCLSKFNFMGNRPTQAKINSGLVFLLTEARLSLVFNSSSVR